MNGSLASRLRTLCRELTESAPPGLAAQAASLLERLDGPLVVALAGRTKAGKSTLLNALVGERVAPTDMSECTKYVTWYHDGPDYLATLVAEGGARRRLPFTRDGGQAAIDVPASADDHAEIVVTLPSRRLQRLRLADTPGFDSATPLLGERTRRLIAPGDSSALLRVDATVYLLRMAHAADAAFLEVFDSNGVPGSPVAAVGVLSRADELLDAGPSAMDDAAEVAASMARPGVLGGLVGTIVPVSGLLAETAVTLREYEFACLRDIASTDPAERERSLVSIDRFCAGGPSTVSSAAREDLARRLGLFGLRWALARIASGTIRDSGALSRALASVSGLDALRDILETRFESRAQRLVCRSVLASLRSAQLSLNATEPRVAARLSAELERIEAQAHELAELRLLEAVVSGDLGVTPVERLEVERLVEDGIPARRLGANPSMPAARLREAAAGRAMYWRERAQNPVLPPRDRALLEVAARSYEGIYAALIEQ